MIRLAVLGSPVAHSLSPALHNAGYRASGLADWDYTAIECDAERLPGLVAASPECGRGFSVTMPGKAAAAEFAADRSSRVRTLGVANTLWRNADGGWSAENTDVDGITGALRAAGVPAPLGGVLVLGGGHTARAVVAAVAEYGCGELVLAGRRPQSTAGCADLARELGLAVRTIPLEGAVLAAEAMTAGLLVSTVPAGVADPFAPMLSAVPVLLDVVYHPWPTPLAAAGGPDRVTVTGLDMLLHQAFRQFEIFTGRPAPRAAMREGLLAASGAVLPLPTGGE